MAELTAEAVVDRNVPRTPRLSPDGRWVAFASSPVGRTGKHPVSGLWLAPADGSAPPRELAPSDAEDHEPRWAPDSGSVFFLSDRVERGTAQLYRVGLAGGGPEQLTDWSPGVHAHLWLPGWAGVGNARPAEVEARVPPADWSLGVFVAPDPDFRPADPRVRVVTAEGSRAGEPGRAWDTVARPDRLWLLDPRTRAVRSLADFGERHVVEVAARPDGGVLAVLTWSVADRDPGLFEPGLHLVDPGSGAVRDLGAPALEASSLTWWRGETGWHLGYLGLTPPGLVGGRAVFEAGETSGAHRNLTAGLTVCPAELVPAGDGPPLALFSEGLDTTVRRLEPATGTFTELTRAPGTLQSLSVADGEVIAAVASTAYEPDVVCAGSAAGPLTHLAEPPLRGIVWGTQERLSYRAEDGLELDGLLILPPGKTREDGPFPLVTLVHGGPDDRYADRFHLNWYPSGQWLATAGFAVFLPNPRGGWGHGHAFAVSVAGAVGGAEFTDILTGIDRLVDDGVADPRRLGIGGGSHGGFMAAWAVSQTDRFAAALVSAGVIDWRVLAATGELTRFDAALGGPDGSTSPITHAHRIRTPTLILHGEDDTNVPLSQADLLHHALRDRGVEHEYVVYPREGHSLRERDHQLDGLRRTREWFSRWLAPERPVSKQDG
ncbi:S9 family peptidase [Amycolatopsis balhimycina DSM 5908]|uniref:S9 family peptidase n=1 Tax=Amycolatopsis balhimycina DSM 5908 TaxID=1081091 RepID=A0A428WBT7_AMYBA|nr:prolyl oligopeptidase family serine peptidase [Amycolatopsis balhimycina]RSM40576.1 S9 family peptidase [Amycolatopsis balhimycina DSM 5908]